MIAPHQNRNEAAGVGFVNQRLDEAIERKL
jgi:hypothetical protein